MGSTTLRSYLLTLAVAASTLAFGGAAHAQTTGSVRGRVVEAGSGRPLTGVQVGIAGSARGALTSAAGDYVLTGVPSGRQTIRARLIAYAPRELAVEVTAGESSAADFSLAQAAITLDQMVVTGVPGIVSKRTLGNAITTIDAAEITQKVSNVNVTELLQAKAPGVTILPGGGSPGTGASIRIRGTGSLNASASPVVYIDGVRMHTSAQGAFWNSWRTQRPGEPSAGAGQEAMALDMLNPQDIESVEVIKGPAAATLYGADAASGVIQVITKRGKPGEQRLQWSAKAQTGQDHWAVDRVKNYTTCTPAIVASRLDDGTVRFPGCQGRAGALLTRTPLDDAGALRNGSVADYSVGVRGGGNGYSFYAEGGRNDEEGVYANSMNSRTSARANFAFYPTDKVDFAVNVGYNKLHTQFPINDDGYGVIQGAVFWRPGYFINVNDPNAKCPTEGFAGPGPACVYDWWNNHLRANRTTLGTTVNFRPLSWLKNRLTVGLDQNDRITDKYLPPGSIYGGTDGEADRGSPSTSLYSVDYAGTISTNVPYFAALSSAFSFGSQYTSNQYRNTVATGSGFASGTIRQVSLAAQTQSFTEHVDQKSVGMYAQEQVGWRDRLYLTAALRVDNNSAFGSDISWLAYPKLSAAYTISEEPFFKRFGWVDQMKLRVAWGQAGNVPAPFAGERSFTSGATVDATGRRVPALLTGQFGNPAIKPERGVEIESGVDASFLQNRLGLELTYYNKTTKDALMQVPVPPSTGFLGNRLENLGRINNRGIEMALNATLVQRRAVTWDSRLGLSTNHNKLVSFGYERDPMILTLYQPVQRHQAGYPLGAYWGTFPKRDASGKLLENVAGALVAGDPVYVGPSTPTRELSLGNTFTIFGNFRVFGLLDYKGGHYLYNVKDQYRCWGGSFTTTWSTNAAQNIPGSCWEVNDPGRSEEYKRVRQQDPSINNGLFIQKADFIKLRDVSLTYTLPQSWAHRAGTERAALTLAAHNVAILWKPHYTGPDPEVNFTGVNDPGSYFSFIRVDSWTAPMTRRITAALELSF